MLAETTATSTHVASPPLQNDGAYVTPKENTKYLTTSYYTKQSRSKWTKNTVEIVFLPLVIELENKSAES